MLPIGFVLPSRALTQRISQPFTPVKYSSPAADPVCAPGVGGCVAVGVGEAGTALGVNVGEAVRVGVTVICGATGETVGKTVELGAALAWMTGEFLNTRVAATDNMTQAKRPKMDK